jgi:hypothetical protein
MDWYTILMMGARFLVVFHVQTITTTSTTVYRTPLLPGATVGTWSREYQLSSSYYYSTHSLLYFCTIALFLLLHHCFYLGFFQVWRNFLKLFNNFLTLFFLLHHRTFSTIAPLFFDNFLKNCDEIFVNF